MSAPLVVTGEALTAADVLDVARGGRRVELAPAAVERMGQAWGVVQEALRAGRPVYGLTTGVGAHKRIAMTGEQLEHDGGLLLAGHRVGQGPDAPADLVREALLRQVDGLARGTTGVRRELAARLVGTLNADDTPACACSGRWAGPTWRRWPTLSPESSATPQSAAPRRSRCATRTRSRRRWRRLRWRTAGA